MLLESGLPLGKHKKEPRTKKQNQSGKRWIFTWGGGRRTCQLRIGDYHCKQSCVWCFWATASLRWSSLLGSIWNLEKKKATTLHGHWNAIEIKHLSTCKHWKAKLAERKKKGVKRKKKSEYCKLRSSPRSCNLAFFLRNESLRGNWSQLEGVTHFAYGTNTKWTEIITYLWGFYRFKLDWEYKNKLGLCSSISYSAWKCFSLKLVCANWAMPSAVFLNLDFSFFWAS